VLVEAARGAAAGAAAIVVEGVGGLLVPLNDTETVRDLAVLLGLPLVIAARPGLGTISHTLLTLEAARAAGLEVRAVVLTPWPAEPEVIHLSNKETIERMGAVEVVTLADGAYELPAHRWLTR
jgi:dethiobiotin synthetase